jgi:branched-chain amino acid transport system ATP-binding protein
MLEVKNVSAQYGDLKILHGVSLKVDLKRIVTLVGANGAGKTTLMKVISGLIRPSSGSVLFDGSDLANFPAFRIVEKGLVQIPEGRSLFYKMCVLENLLIGACHEKAKKDVDKSLRGVYKIFPILDERKKQSARTLSGGEQQMLAIARAMMSCPKLILMDEPSLGLAPLMVKKIFGVIQNLNEEGLSIFLVEQNIKSSLKISHYGYVLENGRIVLEGNGDSLLNNEYTKKAYLGML